MVFDIFYAGIKHLVNGVKPILYEGFPTEAETCDFVRYYRDHPRA